jgi:Mn-dependent DtxR family transcriptional regulator
MEFDRLLSHYDDDALQQEQVALIFYYLEQFDDREEVTQADIKNIIQSSRSTISTSSVSTYFQRLDNELWITTTENDGYRLTHLGEEEVERLLNEEALNDHRDEDDLFIDTDAVDDERYGELIEDINDSYRYRIHSGTMVLTRKLFEDMIFEILKSHYAGEDVQMFYDQENDCHYSFNELLNNLKDGVSTLRRYSRELDDAFVEEIRDIKNAGNKGAHSIRVDFTDEEVEAWSDDATRIAEVLYDVLLGAQIACESDETN